MLQYELTEIHLFGVIFNETHIFQYILLKIIIYYGEKESVTFVCFLQLVV
jgi:hypothetical protein